MNYAESGDENEDEEDIAAFSPVRPSKTRGRQLKRNRTRHISNEEDDFEDFQDQGLQIDEGTEYQN